MTEKQDRKIRREAYKFFDEQIYERTDLSNRDIAQIAFHAGAGYILKNKHEFGHTADDLLEFLAKRDALVPYIENILKRRPNELINVLKERCSINTAFEWRNTPQGHNYWSELQKEFFGE